MPSVPLPFVSGRTLSSQLGVRLRPDKSHEAICHGGTMGTQGLSLSAVEAG